MSADRTETLVGSAVPPPSGGPRFAADDLLAGRYRIVRFIAAGGMGEVYEAEDLELSVRIALKTVRPELAARAGAPRLLREIQLARKITDRHVCRCFDIGRHGDVAFLTMELLHGETLAARLDRGGPLAPDAARRLALDLAAALGA